MKIAFVYDRVNTFGGAEQVLLALHKIWPQTPLYTAVYDPKKATWAKTFKVKPSWINHIPFLRSHHQLFPWLMPYAFESFNFTDFDIVISITSSEAKGIITGPNTLHVCYLLTPTRYLWSHSSHYQSNSYTINNPITKPIISALLSQMRTWDWVAAQRPDKLIPISKTVAKRSKKYYDRQPSQVIFPPVKTNPSPPVSPKKSFYLVVSRLVPYKRIDLAIKACNQIRANLVVIGTGSQEKTLKKLAGPTITFKGFVPEKKLTKYYQQAQALIFAAEEDFGITSVEAQSYGTPVIGFAKGGVAETVIDGETGVLFAKQTPKSIISAIKKYENLTFSPNRAITNAQKFSENKFRTQFKKFVEAAWQKHKTK